MQPELRKRARDSISSKMEVEDYNFMQIKDAISSLDQQVNLIGVVVETSLPRSTKGTDCFCSVKIIDESHPLGLCINFFGETMEKLPHVDSVGDIVLVSHVEVKLWKSEVYALFKKNISSFALFEGGDRAGSCKEFVPYQSSWNYISRDQDKNFIMGLRKCSIQHKFEGLKLNELSSLREIKEGEDHNLLCKILHVCKVKKDEWMLFVWDGTDAPPLSVEAKLENEMENPLPLQLEPCPLSRETLCTFPHVGTVLRMIVDQQNLKVGIQFVKINRWVKIMGVKYEARAALWQAVLMPSSRICYLPDDVSLKGRRRSYKERVLSKWKRMPLTSYPWPSHITETDTRDAAFATLMNVLTHGEVTYMYRCVVRVVAIFPWKVEDFRSPSGIYRLRLTLEDPTARIHAYLYAEDATQFFGDHQSVDVLTKIRNMLLGVGEEHESQEVSRNPPWIDCCLKSYYTDESDVWGSRNHRIFDTKFRTTVLD